MEKSGFIRCYHPFDCNEKSLLKRYAIDDNYLQYYFKFIHPFRNNIDSGAYNRNPQSALKLDSYLKWLGFSFERFCRRYHFVIARILQFSGVHYQSGTFFNRATDRENPGFQIDLLFERADQVYTVCEIKYLQKKVDSRVIEEVEKKLSLFPNQKNKTIQKVLICNEGAEQARSIEPNPNEILTAKDLLDPRNW